MSLRAESISFGYGRGRAVLQDVSAEVRPGRVLGILGPNGAGKSTLVRVMLGLERPRSGRVVLRDGEGSSARDHEVTTASHVWRARRLVWIPQRLSLALGFTVAEYVAMGLPSHAGGRHDGVIREVLDRVELSSRGDDAVQRLSIGEQQRAALARAMAQCMAEPGVAAVLADEPVSAMDPRHALSCLEGLRMLATSGRAVGVVLHDVAMAGRYCDEALVLDATGCVVACGPVTEVLTPGLLTEVFGVRFEVRPILSACGAEGSGG